MAGQEAHAGAFERGVAPATASARGLNNWRLSLWMKDGPAGLAARGGARAPEDTRGPPECLACFAASISPYSTVPLLMEIISRQMRPAITRMNGIINWSKRIWGN